MVIDQQALLGNSLKIDPLDPDELVDQETVSHHSINLATMYKTPFVQL